MWRQKKKSDKPEKSFHSRFDSGNDDETEEKKLTRDDDDDDVDEKLCNFPLLDEIVFSDKVYVNTKLFIFSLLDGEKLVKVPKKRSKSETYRDVNLSFVLPASSPE